MFKLSIFCVVCIYSFANDLKSINERIFNSYYSDKNITIFETNSSINSFSEFNLKMFDLAIVREDILHKDDINITNDFFVLSNINKEVVLYFITKNDKISSLKSLKDKNISVGSSGNLVFEYLSEFCYINNLNINFAQMSEIESIDMVKNELIDGAFIFGSKNLINTLASLNIKVKTLPKKLIRFLVTKNSIHRAMVKDIYTVGIDNFVIVSKTLFYNDRFFKLGSSEKIEREIIKKDKRDLITKKYLKFKNSKLNFELFTKSSLKNKIFLYYHINNETNTTIDLEFEEIRTKSFDTLPYKARHVLDYGKRVVIAPKSRQKLLIAIENSFAINFEIYGILIFMDKNSKKRVEIPFLFKGKE